MPKYLSQVLAVEQDVRANTRRQLTDLHHALQTPNLLKGRYGTYRPFADGEEHQLPDEWERVQYTAKELIAATRSILVRLFDITAARDFTNSAGSVAVADVEVDGEVLLQGAPAPYLLWLEKQLDDINTFVAKLPTLDPSTVWTLDDAARGVWKSKPVETRREVRRPAKLVLFEPTDRQPGQAQVYEETSVAGIWTRYQYSGALEPEEKAAMLGRVEALKQAVGAARQKANRIEAVEPKPGADIIDYVFSG